MSENNIKSAIEAFLFSSDRPLSIDKIRGALDNLDAIQVRSALTELMAEYEQASRGMRIVEIAGGFQMITASFAAPFLRKLYYKERRVERLSKPALETLAILAYKQPMTRAEIEEIRGVDASGVLSNLADKGFVKIVGKKEIPGRPFLYGTTEKFLEHFGLNTIKDLPSIEELQTLVDSSIKKEDLLGTQNIIDVPEDDESDAEQGPSAKANEAVEEAALEDDIIDEIISAAEFEDSPSETETPAWESSETSPAQEEENSDDAEEDRQP